MTDDAHEDPQEQGESPQTEASPDPPDDPTAGIETIVRLGDIVASGPRVLADYNEETPKENEQESDDDPTEGIETGLEWRDLSFRDVVKRDRRMEMTEADEPRPLGEESTEREGPESEPADDPTKGIDTGLGIGDIGDERRDDD